MVELDHRVGQILDEVDALGIAEHTVFRRQAGSNREGFVYYIEGELRAVKWRDWKMHLVWEPEPNVGPIHLETSRIFNLLQDPKEETDLDTQHAWVRRPLRCLSRISRTA